MGVAHRIVITLVVAILASVAPGAQNSKPSKGESLNGYAEWVRGNVLIADGQRVLTTSATTFKGQVRRLADIALGYEIEVKGVRAASGYIVAKEIEAKPNGSALFENEVRQGTDELEANWLRRGEVYEPDEDGTETVIGEIVGSGPQVDRVRRITRSLLPPYVSADGVRPHIVDSKDWNAMAMGNGSLWVFTGLLDDMNDDEVAIVVGHELAHYTHEHSRRGFRRAMWTQLILVGAMVASEAIDDKTTKAVVGLGSLFALMAWQNGYGRDMEDQADRVGLRYAFEAGYDVSRGPALWRRFQKKYGDTNAVVTFFFADHSQASARVRNLEREIALNYPDAASRAGRR